MRATAFAVGILVLVSGGILTKTHAQTNSWINPTGDSWQNASNWSLGITPSTNDQSLILFTNAATKTVTIDATTSGSFPDSLTISNLVVSAPAPDSNILSLTNAGLAVPLQVMNACSVSNGGALTVDNSALVVQGGPLSVDGTLVLNTGSIAANAGMQVGFSSAGTVTLTGGTLTASYLLGTTNATLNFSGGVLETGDTSLANPLTVGDGTNFAWLRLTGGTNGFGSGLTISSNAQLTGCRRITSPLLNNGTVLANCGASILAFMAGVTNNGIMIATNLAVISFSGPVVNNGTIDARAGGLWFASGVVNNGTILPSGPPPTPTDLEARLTYLNTSNTAHLFWHRNTTNAYTYSIEESFFGSGFQPAASVWDTDTYFDPNFTTNFPIAYRVRAAGSIGYSAYSNIATAGLWTTTNSWINPGNEAWQNSTNWFLSQSPSIFQTLLVTNSNTKTITIDSTTSSPTFSNTLTVADLILSAPNGSTNILNLTNASTNVLLRVAHTLNVGAGALLNVYNSSVLSDALFDGGFIVDGQAVLDFDSLVNATSLYCGLETNANGSILGIGWNYMPLHQQLYLTGLQPSAIGVNGSGQVVITNGFFQVSPGFLFVGSGSGSQGTLTATCDYPRYFDSPTSRIVLSPYGRLVLGMEAGSVGSVQIAQVGQLFATNHIVLIGCGGSGALSLSNSVGYWWTNTTSILASVEVGGDPGSQGTMTVAEGRNFVQNTILMAASPGSTGTIWMTGGELGQTNTHLVSGVATYWPAYVGSWGAGFLTISNGTWRSGSMVVGSQSNSQGTVTLVGGTNAISSKLVLGNWSNAVGTVQVVGGNLIMTNASILVGNYGFGQMTVSSGTVKVASESVGVLSGSQGTLTIAGGTETVSSNLVIGNCANGALGLVTVADGILYVTNAAHNAFIDVRNGQLNLNGGVLQTDRLVMTNACGLLVRGGGTLIVSNLVLDPNLSAIGDGIPNGWKQQFGLDPLDSTVANADPDGDGFSNLQEYLAGTDPTTGASAFRVLSILPQGNDFLITWSAATNKTYVVQVGTNGSDGSYTNSFTDLATVIVPAAPSITETNYLDIGAVTNGASRFYRIRLGP